MKIYYCQQQCRVPIFSLPSDNLDKCKHAMTMTSWNALLHQFLITLMRFFSPFDPKFNNNTDIKARHRNLTPWPVVLDHSDLLITERTVREKKKETRKGGLERFFSLQAALPRLFLGRILPK
jgi:hypothetical protein